MKNVKYFVVTLLLIVGLTGCFKSDQKELENTNWISATDLSYMQFLNSKDWIWYKQKDDKNNYYKGTYKLYLNENAKKYLTNDLKDYGVTEEEINRVTSARVGETLICFTVDMTSYMLEGVEQLKSPNKLHYFGFLSKDKKKLSMSNMANASSFNFEKE